MTTIEMDQYLVSIGGLENGWKTDMPKILDSGFMTVCDGWLQLIHDLIEEIIPLGWNKEICQIKEKFGGLRFYTNAAPSSVHEVITKYENLSRKTCETCGKPGTMRRTESGWHYTSCNDCDKK